jgi:hypothetical protein
MGPFPQGERERQREKREREKGEGTASDTKMQVSFLIFYFINTSKQ